MVKCTYFRDMSLDEIQVASIFFATKYSLLILTKSMLSVINLLSKLVHTHFYVHLYVGQM